MAEVMRQCSGWLWLHVSPVGELISFSWPKESNQRNSHPWCVGPRIPGVVRRRERRGNSPFGLKHPASLFLGRLRYSAIHKGFPGKHQCLAPNSIYEMTFPEFPPSALPNWRGRAGKERNPVRAPQHGAFCVPCQGELLERPPARANSGTRREAMWGGPQAKSEAAAIFAYCQCV